jgi:hypothetical protein
LATGKPVVQPGDRTSILHQIADREPVAPTKIADKLPRDLETVILKALSKEPSGRYATAQEMASDLTRFLDDKPVLARRPSLARHAIKWARRHRALVGTSLATFLISLVVCLMLVTRAYQTAESERNQAKANLSKARENLQLARSAVDDMYVNVATEWLAKEFAISAIYRCSSEWIRGLRRTPGG